MTTSGFYTYLHCKPDGTPFYVGKGRGGRSHNFRWRSSWHKSIVAKYGSTAIEVLVFPRDTEQAALDTEIAWIKTLRLAGYELCNLTAGGDRGITGYKFTAESKAKMSDAHMGRKQTPESNAKRSATLKGRETTVSHRAHLSAALQGKKHSPESKHKMSIAKLGRATLQEQRDKLSAANKGKPWSAKRRLAQENQV